MNRRCPNCRQRLPADEFDGTGLALETHGGLSVWCRRCRKDKVEHGHYKEYYVRSGNGLVGKVVGLRIQASEISVRFERARLVRLELEIVQVKEEESAGATERVAAA